MYSNCSIKQGIVSILILLLSLNLTAQKEITTFIFGHSLINHEFQINPTPSQETSLPHWLHFLSLESNHTFKVSGQYGFLPQHANLPPNAQWGFDFAEGAWDSDNVPFADADFNSILITPGNFVQWQPPSTNYPMETISPTSATETVFNWCNDQEAGLDFYIYENWPDMRPYLANGFPPTEDEWSTYNDYLNSDFRDWFLDYHNELNNRIPNSCIKLIPAGTLISKLLSLSPYSEIPIQELYEDDAPHGRTTVYFLASLITYMAIYEERAPKDYQVDPLVHPTIAQNYNAVIDLFWDDLLSDKMDNGDFRVFCNKPISTVLNDPKTDIELVTIQPNPTTSELTIVNNDTAHFLEVLDFNGSSLIKQKTMNRSMFTIDTNELDNGMYLILGKDEMGKTLYAKKFIKI